MIKYFIILKNRKQVLDNGKENKNNSPKASHGNN